MPTSQSPRASIVVVTFNSAETIEACLRSIRAATATDHDVVVVDNASRDDGGDRARRLGARVIANAENRGFSAACNQGIAATRGEFVVLLNPDTVVTPGWLERLLAPLRGDVGATGPLSTFVAGAQKVGLHLGGAELPGDPAEAARLVAERNAGRTVETKLLIGFCLAMRRDLVERHGGLDEDLFLGNDDLEYSLRLRRLGYRLLVAADAFVVHLGQRSFRSLPSEERARLVQESTDALQRKLEAEYGAGRVPAPMELWGVDWFRPTGAPRVSIVVPVWNNLAYTRLCLGSVAQHTPAPHEVIVVDNGSNDGTPEWLAARPGVRVIRNAENRGFAAATNQGLLASRGEHSVLLNNDVVVTPEWLDGLLAHLDADPRLGIVAPRTNCSSGPQLVPNVGYRSLDALDAFAMRFRSERRGQRAAFPRVTGLCMLVRGDCRRAVGLLDERFGVGNFEDDDYCVRARAAGFGIAIAQDVFVHHFGSKTFKALGIDYGKLLEENKRKFLEKWQPAPK